jgi:hypothetical protein
MQTFLDYAGTNNKSQIYLSLPANSIVKAISDNLTCALVYSSSDASYLTYLFDQSSKTASQFSNITNIPGLLASGNMPGSTFRVSSGCNLIKFNNTVYKYNNNSQIY